ncbi:MAG TPA: hypothetical protein VMY18_12290 [Acidobacteriota bacterium]|nr:hypothetical protein [Acidobacteriota bacterium]
MTRYKRFDRSRLELKPLCEREHLLTVADVLEVEALPAPENPKIKQLAHRINSARTQGAEVILMMGAHLLRAGVTRHIIRLIEQGFITHVGMNGAVPIHDYEMAQIGATTESVAKYVKQGEFGLWEETGQLNDIVKKGRQDQLGFGEAVGKAIHESDFPHRELSLLAAAYRKGIPATVHVGIGYDIIHEHPSCDGAALGAASYDDFLIFAHTLQNLENGVFLNYGTAVMGPEVYLKALTMARNLARQQGQSISRFTSAVFDLVPLDDDLSIEPTRENPHYYFRPLKTVLIRTVADGGSSFYIQGPHRQTFLDLFAALQDLPDKS